VRWLIEEQTTTTAGYRQRAAVREYLGDIDGAISDLELIIAQESKEPADFHAVGIRYCKVGQTSKAEAAFSDVLEQGRKARNAYYRNSSYLFRAELRWMRMDRAGAHNDAVQLPDGYSTYIPGAGMRSKEQILARVAAI
jgi:tetratricopeptide (TPR) repeat protein